MRGSLLRFARLAGASLALVASLQAGCGSDAGCAELCEGDKRCSQPDLDVGACTRACEGLAADDGDYRVAVEARAECYEDADCSEIQRGECDGDGR